MYKILYILLILITVTNCSTKKIEFKHGVSLLENKYKNLNLNQDNKNDIIKKLGPPSTQGLDNQNLLIYIEKKNTRSSIFKLGKKKELTGNVLVLELDNFGVLKNKQFYNLDNQNNIKFFENKTDISNKESFIYGVMSSLRQKIDSPKRNKKVTNQQ